MAGKVKTNEVILQSPNGLVEKTLKLNDDGTVSIDAHIKQDGYYIVESGSNANGHYTKFSDGTMICRNFISGTTSNNSAIIFPATFSSNSIVITFGHKTVTGVTVYEAGLSALSFLIQCVTTAGGGTSVSDVRYIAIGRWK